MGEWVHQADEEGDFVHFTGKGDVDECFEVYLPSSDLHGEERDRAIRLIIEALNDAGIVVE